MYAHGAVSEPPVATAELPAPTYDYYYGPGPIFGVAGAAMGSGGSSFEVGVAAPRWLRAQVVQPVPLARAVRLATAPEDDA